MNPLLTNIRAVVFDAGGTLFFPKTEIHLIYADIGKLHGSTLSAEVIGERYRAAFQRRVASDDRWGWQTSEEIERQRWRAVVAEVFSEMADTNACFETLFQHFAKPEVWELAPDAAATLRALAEHGLQLAIASNFDHRLHTIVAGHPALKAIQHVVVSSEVGWRKPAKGFFDAVCARVGQPAEQILFVGDDRSNDYEGARAAGMRAVLLDPERRHPDFESIRFLSDLTTGKAGSVT